MATLRKWLENAGVDWNSLVIVAHTLTEDSYSAGWGESKRAFKFDYRENKLPDSQINGLLDFDFDDGYGAPEAPRFVARDKDKTYFPVQYDGATWIDSVYHDINIYMDTNNDTPYPGGG